MERTAAFYFTDLGDSYAARTGRPRNVGVVGVAVFQEEPQAGARRDTRDWDRAGAEENPAYPESKTAAPSPPLAARQEAEANSAAQPPAAAPRERADLAADALSADSRRPTPRSLGKLGTGHGRSEDSRVTLVAFERRTDSPAEIVAIQYDRREKLAAMNVLPRPYYARAPQPEPFPAAIRFVPDLAR